jgi:SAM-dependent methyltransferase
MTTMSEAFRRAYKDSRWHHGSGSGSSEANTAQYRAFLQQYMRDHQIRSVLDIGCGDWQFSRLINWSGIFYHGIDVVPELILANTIGYGHGWRSFSCADVLNGCQLPNVGLVLAKDLLQHWPDAAVHELRRKLDGRRALLTYDLERVQDGIERVQIEPGGYRPLDLTAAPFSWPVRERLRYESVSHEGTVRRVKVVMEMAP